MYLVYKNTYLIALVNLLNNLRIYSINYAFLNICLLDQFKIKTVLMCSILILKFNFYRPKCKNMAKMVIFLQNGYAVASI